MALSKLQHPNTLRIYDFGYIEPPDEGNVNLGPRPFQVSEFLDGGNLEQHVRARGALTPDETLAILERMAGASEEAHGHGIIHRDIKPSNILFSRVGGVLMPKLADFGIARVDLKKRPRPGEVDNTIETTMSTVPLFSPRWAAPEQLAGASEGPYTDVYALALVAAFMLAGRAPFDVEDVRATFTERVRNDDLVGARLIILGFAPDVRSVLLAAMRANPGTRTPRPLMFFDALNHVLGGANRSMPPHVPSQPPESITLESWKEQDVEIDPETAAFVPAEQLYVLGERKVRVVEVSEKLDLTISSGNTIEVRFRVTMLPGKGPLRVNIKGLTCFVASEAGRPTPAIVTDRDGGTRFISTQRSELGSIEWQFGESTQSGRVFNIDGEELFLPYPQATQAIAIDLGNPREVIVICRRG